MLRRLAAASLLLVTTACGPAPSIDGAAAEAAVPAAGAGRVAFLPPLGEAPPLVDAAWDVSPAVRIEALPPAAPEVAAAFLPGTPSAPVRTGNHWLVPWRTGASARAGVTYRIRVLDGATELGSVDVLVVAPGGKVRDGVRSAVLGRTLPVKFTIAAGAGEERPWLERVSVDSAGAEGDGPSSAAAISADGRFVAFSSEARTLVAADGNGVRDVFVHDRSTRETSRVSVGAGGGELSGWSAMAAISGDGRRVAFVTTAPELGGGTGALAIAVRDRASGVTTVASARADGTPNPRDAAHPALSGDGRHVAFSTPDMLVVPDDGNWFEDVFVRDLETGDVRIASLRADGGPADGACAEASLSHDGRLVAFASSATNLVDGDGNGQFDVFVKDLQTGAVVRASAGSAGEEANGQSRTPRISADGRFVAFQSLASNLAPGDGNGTWDVFVHDLATGVTVLASARPDGVAGSAASTRATISADGRLVAFQSAAGDLVPGDGNGVADAFVRDLVTGTTVRASVDALGAEAAGEATSPAISADGSAVAFASDAATLVPDDRNGARDVFVRRLR